MTIKEVSQKYHVTEATLRYYEKEKVLFPVTRKNGIRNYEETNLNNLEFVLCMRKAGMSMERLKNIFYYLMKNIVNKKEEIF